MDIRQKRVLESLQKLAKKARSIVFKAAQEDETRSLIEQMGANAFNEWRRIEDIPEIDTSSPYCVTMKEIMADSHFEADEKPSRAELNETLAKIEDAINRAAADV